jgi:hypothetical protein
MHTIGQRAGLACVLAIVACLVAAGPAARAQPVPVQSGQNGRLVYAHDEQGNRIPDFSHCGYAGADRAIPDVPARVTVAPADGDDGSRIQAAINAVAGLPIGDDGFRGAVLLAPGQFDIAGQLRITASGVVLRGSGAGDGGTTLLATGTDRRTLVRIAGEPGRSSSEPGRPRPRSGPRTARLAGALAQSHLYHVRDAYVPVGATALRLNATAGLRVGETILITRPSTAEWIETLGARAFGVGWRPGSRDLVWDRVINAIENDTITLDAPITTAIEKRFGGATVAPYDRPGRIENVGVEDLRIDSTVSGENPRDEDHAWHGVTLEHVANAWVRRVEFRHLAGGAVALWERTKWITVEDCIAREPVSEDAGYRRHTFFTQGQLALFLRCWSEHGRHDFAVGHCAAGPNAFVNCRAAEALGDSGPLESWAAGVLYDNVRIDGGDLRLANRWSDPPGTGWSAANCVLWQCRAATIDCFRPPTANNWALGCWATFAGDGTFAARSDFVRPLSLYQAQLGERLGDEAAARVDPILGRPVSATNPTLDEAAEFVAQSDRPPRRLVDVIRERIERGARSEERVTELPDAIQPPAPSPQPPDMRLAIENGWLVAGGELVTGGELRQGFWRGTIRPHDAAAFGPAITRFVPGRVGTGFTDDLEQVADGMLAAGRAVYEHHYGLWYDRRRDDHLMVRRADGHVAPPFYEQPFARTGRGTAWDGLSKYDLTKFNPWYWNRLGEFARLCDQRGLVLVHQNYFQHNILEAGAHWADCPWRPANNVNDTGLVEPPPYIGDKRLFMAANFYDVANAKLRALHRGYIRQCLDNFADSSNVIQMTSAEYSGPLEFTQFWLDTIVQWEQEHGRDVLIGLSAPKDVQDAILADPERGPHVDVIDIRYWTYTAGGGLYAPAGGQNLAPRQHLRQTRQKPGGAAAIVRAVREYRTRYPDKAVIYNADQNCPSTRDGWAVLIGGGSLADIKLPAELARIVPTLRPVDGVVHGEDRWCLAGDHGDYLIYAERDDATLDVELPGQAPADRGRWLDAHSGRIIATEKIADRTPRRMVSKVLWLSPSDPKYRARPRPPGKRLSSQ